MKNAVSDLKAHYPVAVDSDHSIWRAFRNEYWPADYMVADTKGRIRYRHFGEGEYEKSERVIQALLKEKERLVSMRVWYFWRLMEPRRHRVKMYDRPKRTSGTLARRTSRRRSGWGETRQRPTAHRRGPH